MALLSVQTDSNVFRFGTQSLKCTTGDTGNNAIFPSSPVAVVPGESRTLSAYIRTNAPMTGGSIRLRVAQSGVLTPVLADSIAITDSSLLADVVDGFGRVSVTFVVPDGIFEVRPFIQYTGTTAGQVFWVDGSKFEKGDKASIWQENIVSGRTVLDQMGLMVDAFRGGIMRLIGSVGGTRDSISLGPNGLLFGSDTELYSATAGQLRVVSPAATNSDVKSRAPSGQRAFFTADLEGDTSARMLVGGDGTTTGIELGPGNASRDVTLKRSAANVLQLAAGDTFEAEKVNMTQVTTDSALTFAGGGTATFGTDSVTWARLGPWVFFELTFTVTANGSGATTVTVAGTGLPNPVGNVVVAGDRGAVGVTRIVGRFIGSGGAAVINQMHNLSGFTIITGADLTNGNVFRFHGIYRTNDAF